MSSKTRQMLRCPTAVSAEAQMAEEIKDMERRRVFAAKSHVGQNESRGLQVVVHVFILLGFHFGYLVGTRSHSLTFEISESLARLKRLTLLPTVGCPEASLSGEKLGQKGLDQKPVYVGGHF